MNYPAVALAALVLISGASSQTQHALMVAHTMGPTQLTIENYAFKAPSITVTTGTTVVWKNLDDDPHTVTADGGSFDSSGLANGDTYSRQFTKPGSYPYHCKLHPFMKGVVVVKGSGS